jgi:transposase
VVIVYSTKGYPVKDIVDALGCGTATVTRARQRSRKHGEAGLIDRREDNQSHGQRIRLHFLPPYCPDENRIEHRLWPNLHRNVPYNDQCQTLDELAGEVREYHRRHNPRVASQEKSGRRKVI